MGKKLTQEEYFNRASEVHNHRYGYDESVYVSSHIPIVIECRIHGKFTQSASIHLHGHGCPKCHIEADSLRKTKTQEVYLEECAIKHNYFYGYDKAIYTGCENKMTILCPIHGYFDQKAANHRFGGGCRQCSNDKVSARRRRTKEKFVEQADIVHDNWYDYSKSEYDLSVNKITITCPVHGDFIQKPMDHLAGCGCTECGRENNVFKKMDWVNKSKNKIGTFYIIRCYNETESFYKYGITYNGLKSRYSRKDQMPYKYEMVRLVISTDKEYIWDLEKRFGRFKRKDRYSPNIPFAGSKNECFSDFN